MQVEILIHVFLLDNLRISFCGAVIYNKKYLFGLYPDVGIEIL